MKKAIYLLAIALLFSYCGRGKGKKPTVRAEERIQVRLLPSGVLSSLPEKLSLSFSRGFPTVKGLKFSPAQLGKYIEITPSLPISGYWTSSSVFIIKPEAPFKAGALYTLRIKYIPLKGKKIKTSPEKFTLKLPVLRVIGASVIRAGKYTEISLRFNATPWTQDMGKFLEITDHKGKKVEVKNARVEDHQLLLTLAVSPPTRIHLRVKKGFPSELGPLPTDFSAEIPVEISKDYMMVDSVKLREAEEGFTMVIKLSSPGGRVDLTGMDPTPFLSFSPPISFSAFSSENFIFVSSKDLVPGLTLEFNLLAGLRDKNGYALKKNYRTTLRVPRRKAKLKFLFQGKYFGRKSGLRIPIRAEGIRNLQISVYYLPPTNSLFWYSIYDAEEWSVSDLGEAIRKFSIKPKEGINWIDLSSFAKGAKPGVYFLNAEGETSQGGTLNSKMQIVLSDISLVAKISGKEIFIWALDASSLNPLSGVRIEVKDRKNFPVGSCITAGDGFCSFRRAKNRSPYFIFARKNGDWTYLHLPSSTISLTNFDVSGEEPKGEFAAFLYPERELYRPGERVNFAFLLRKRGKYQGLSLPVSVKVIDPRGKELLTLTSKTDEAGFSVFSFPTVKTFPTGVYTLRAEVGGKTVAIRRIHIEEFVPERMGVKTQLPEKIPGSGLITAQYLFGAPAAGQNFTLKLYLREIPWKCPTFPDFHFGPSPETSKPYYSSTTLEGKLDKKGVGNFSVPAPAPPPLPLKVDAVVSVQEAGSGRVTHGSASRVYHLRKFYIGLSTPASRIVEGNPVEVKGILITPKCQILKGNLQLKYTVYRLSYYYSYSYYEEDYGWSSRLIREPVDRGVVLSRDGKFSFVFTPQDSYYDYLVEVMEPGSGQVAQLIIPGWGWFFSGDKPPSPQALSIRLNREEGDEGEEIEAQVKLPFEGKILWTLELHGVLKYKLEEARGEVATWKFSLPEGLPDVYVSALLIRSSENYLVERAFGVKRIRIKPKRLYLPLNLQVPQTMKPGENLNIKVKGKGDFEATIAVVDVGILQITKSKVPDPFQGILKPLSLGVDTAETLGWRIRKFLKPGGGEREAAMPPKLGTKPGFVRIVSFWSGLLKSRGGEINYSVKIPDFNGRLRVMVVAAGEEGFSSVSRDVIVKEDVVVQTTFPRFLAWGDRFSFPITFINTTREEKSVSLKIEARGLKLHSPASIFKLGPEETRTLWVEAEAEKGERAGVDIEAKWEGGGFSDHYSCPLKPNLPRVEKAEFKTLALPGELDITALYDMWLPLEHKTRILISPFPGISALSHLDYIIHYPYGCIEQTSTSTLALVKARKFISVISSEITPNELANMVNRGILRILSMQTYSGGFTFWPGGEEEELWASAYAAFVLQEAKNAGFYVPEVALKGAYSYISEHLKTGLGYFVLSRTGREDMREKVLEAEKKFKARTDLLWIAASLKELGMAEEAKTVLKRAEKIPLPRARYTYFDFRTPIKTTAINLYVREILNPKDPELPAALSQFMTAFGQESYYYTTQEIAWALVALDLYTKTHPLASSLHAVLESDGKAVKPQRKDYLLSFLLRRGPAYRKALVKISGQGNAFISVQMEGFRKDISSFQALSRHIQITRRVLNMEGVPVTSSSMGKLLIMEITVKADGYYDNAAVEVPLPAGFEVENPRLSGEIQGFEGNFYPDYLDIRDDRVIIFGSLKPSVRTYYILVRAVTPGLFFLPPAHASLMYGPGYYGRTPSDVFSVEK